MAEIQIGSLVIYTERVHPSYETNGIHKVPRSGSIGTVVGVTSGYQKTRAAFDVNWHSGGCFEMQKNKMAQKDHYAVWTQNLDLAEMPYDPTQQGDTDEDI